MIIATALTGWIYFISSVPQNTIINNKYNSRVIMFGIWLYTTINILITDNISGDMARYIRNFEELQPYTLSQSIQISNTEPFFTAFTWLISQITNNPEFFRLAVWIIISIPIFIAIRNIFSSYHLLIVLYSFFTYFIVFNFVTNIVRQGIAVSLLLVAVSILITGIKNNKLFLISVILAPFFHLTALPFSLILLFLKKFRIKSSLITLFWIFAMIAYITGLNARIMSMFTSTINYLTEYTSSSVISNYGGTNRIDFLAFSMAIILFGFFAYNFMLKSNKTYKLLLDIYILFNSLFLITGFIAYSDRVAAYSWILMPLIIWYPILKSDKVKKVRILLIFMFLSIFVLLSHFYGGSLFF